MKKVTLELGGRTLEVRPSTLRATKRWLKAQTEVRVGTYEYMDEVSEFIFAALVRAQPDLERDWLEAQIDELNISEVISKVYEAGRISVGEPTRPPETP